MRFFNLKTSMAACGWLSCALALAFTTYVAYALLTGSVQLAAKYSATTVHVGKTPAAFAFAVVLYSLGAVVFAWIGKGLLIDHPKWVRDKELAIDSSCEADKES
jgi:hypothetical protein